MVLAFDHFKAYLLNTQKSVVVFTDARALMWVSRNREYSIACNGLVNKLAKIQLEIPHVVYSVPSEVNYLADIFSRAFSTSRFLDKNMFSLSKPQASNLPPLTEPFVASEADLYRYFTQPLSPENADQNSRKRTRISTPKPITSLYKQFEGCTPEEKYFSAIRLLQGWNDSSLSQEKGSELNSCLTEPRDIETPAQKMAEAKKLARQGATMARVEAKEEATLSTLDYMQQEREDLFKLYSSRIIKKTMKQLYGHLDPVQRKRLEATLRENHLNLFRKNLIQTLEDDFLAFEKEQQQILLNMVDTSNKCISVPIRYSTIHPSCFHPSKQPDSPGIDIPVQHEVEIPAGGHITVDTGVQLYMPPNLCAQLVPNTSTAEANILIHSGFVDDNFSSTIKLILKNISTSKVKIEAGSTLVQALILPLLHPTLLFETSVSSITSLPSKEDSDKDDSADLSFKDISLQGSQGRNTVFSNIELKALPISYLHMMHSQVNPSNLHVLETNTKIILPTENTLRLCVLADLKMQKEAEKDDIQNSVCSAISYPHPDPETAMYSLTRDLINQTICLNSNIHVPSSPSDQNKQKEDDISLLAQESAYNKICEKLAVISVDLIKNQTMTRTMLAQAQQGDDLLSIIRSKTGIKESPFPKFFIHNQILYKKCQLPNSALERHVICIPDILLPAVIHSLHVNLNHTSTTLTKRNFEQYYYNHKATKLIKAYVQSCVTCALAHKFDIKKAVPETARSLQPERPRQYIYCDLIPMYSGTFSYILFCLDAYSQYIYALPIKDKTSASVLQGFLSLFSATGWPEAIYLDNETSFQKTAKLLIKLAPIKVLYSTPYCQFQNWSENYIKNFKKGFLKLLNDSENPQENSDWPLLLPTVTQAINRQIIPNLHLTRESIHFNMNSNFFPLAHLSSEAADQLNEDVEAAAQNAYRIILAKRKKDRSNRNPQTVPVFHETQIVFIRDQAPAISTILKIPNRGPYRIEKLEDRNVTLIDISTGCTVHSHVQNIRPMDFSEYRFLLSKNWDLNANVQKSAKINTEKGIFEKPENPLSEERAIELEGPTEQSPDREDLTNLFEQNVPEQPDPAQNVPDLAGANEQPEPKPPDIEATPPQVILRRSPRLNKLNLTETELPTVHTEPTEEQEQNLSVNTADVLMEISHAYKISLFGETANMKPNHTLPSHKTEKSNLKTKKTISFFLPAPSNIFYPEKDLNDEPA